MSLYEEEERPEISVSAQAHREELCEDTVRRQPFARKEESPHHILTMLDPALGLSNPPSCEKKKSDCWSHQPVVFAMAPQANSPPHRAFSE